STVGIANRIDHDRRHAANRGSLGELTSLHAGHEHDLRVVSLIRNHARRSHADRLWIRIDALWVVLPHLDQTTQVIPAPDVRSEHSAPQDPGDGWKGPAGVSLFVEDFDLERARLDAD